MYISIQCECLESKKLKSTAICLPTVYVAIFSVVDTKASEFNIIKKRFSSNWNYVKR